MQTEIKTICLVSMLAGIISAAIPAGRMKNAFSSFCAVAVVFYMIAPLTEINADSFKLSAFAGDKHDEALLSDVRTAEVMLYEKMLEKALAEKLEQAGFKASLKLRCEKQGEEIKALSVTVAGSVSDEARQSIKKILTDSLGDITVSFEEDENG